MKKLGKIIAFTLILVLISVSAYATDEFLIKNATGSLKVRIDKWGNINSTEGWVAENGVKLTDIYIALADTFAGDVSGTYNAIQVITTQGLSTGNITSGTFDDARISQSSILQHISGGANVSVDANGIISLNTSVDTDNSDDLTTSTSFAGDVSGNYNAMQVTNTQGLSYTNISDLPTCTGTQRLTFDGSTLSCAANLGNTTEEMQDVTGAMVSGNTETHISVDYQDGDGTVDFVVSDDWWNSLADMELTDNYIYVGDGSNDPVGVAMSGHATIDNTGAVTVVNTNGLDYHNTTGMPTCSGGQHLYFDGTDLSCTADSGGTDTWLNSTVAGVETANGVYNYTSTSTIALSEGSRITGENKGGTNMTIDTTGNYIITLG